ncbi:hypothetical protein BDQ17DRAFT_1395744 [Cyathus striatus]|nr:hypothetical protein BDQ17DRAFT_1395744 [Cyathus striatus]
MAAVPNVVDDSLHPSSWGVQEEQGMGPGGNGQPANGTSLPVDDRDVGQDPENQDYSRGASVGDVGATGSKVDSYREKQRKVLRSFLSFFVSLCLDWCLLSAAQPNKVYIGGLPEHTREEDLQNCFGKIGNIINIELKVGYGFVEFDSKEAAEESVAKYHEGFFMGNKIRVEISHGGGRTAKYAGDPGACFKCGQMGHWARECPNHPGAAHRRSNYDPPLIDRIQRDYSRSLPPARDEFPPRYPPRDARYDYSAPPRDFRRPPSPRGYRDYPAPPADRVRDYDDYRRGSVNDRDRYPPADYRGRYPPPDSAYRSYGAPPPATYDRYERRSGERYPPYPPPATSSSRARTPPRVRDDYDRLPPPAPAPARDYPDYRGRPVSPPPARYPAEYTSRMSAEPPATRYRRRSESPRPAYDYPTMATQEVLQLHPFPPLLVLLLAIMYHHVMDVIPNPLTEGSDFTCYGSNDYRTCHLKKKIL